MTKNKDSKVAGRSAREGFVTGAERKRSLPVEPKQIAPEAPSAEVEESALAQDYRHVLEKISHLVPAGSPYFKEAKIHLSVQPIRYADYMKKQFRPEKGMPYWHVDMREDSVSCAFEDTLTRKNESTGVKGTLVDLLTDASTGRLGKDTIGGGIYTLSDFLRGAVDDPTFTDPNKVWVFPGAVLVTNTAVFALCAHYRPEKKEFAVLLRQIHEIVPQEDFHAVLIPYERPGRNFVP